MNHQQKQAALQLAFLCLAVFLITGCIKTYKLVPSETSQGNERDRNKQVAANNIRSVKIYNQWETLAHFDALLLSDEVRDFYVDLHCQRRGKNEHDRETMRSREREAGRDVVSFSVLADVRDQFHPDLKENDAAWTMYLSVGNNKIRPTSVTQVELDPEMQTLFGHRFVSPKYKTPYLVKFPAKDASGRSYLTKSVRPAVSAIASGEGWERSRRITAQAGTDLMPFKLILSSVTRDCELGWHGAHPSSVSAVRDGGEKEKMLGKDEDFYWL